MAKNPQRNEGDSSMTEQQQDLYEKLLKKVNEYCLGCAAEDVIAAIDALVDNYERVNHLPKDKYKVARELLKDTSPLQVWYLIKKYLNIYHHQTVKENIDVETVEGYPISIIEDSLKALEIIKEKILNMDYFNVIADRCDLTYQEYELLRKVLK